MKKQSGLGAILFMATLIGIGIFAGRFLGYIDVVADCERLGGFYYNGTTFRCEVKKT